MKIKFNDDNGIVEVEGYKELVDFMRTSAFIAHKNNHDYMIGYATRTAISRNQDIRATDETSFVEDLLKFKHIELLENKMN